MPAIISEQLYLSPRYHALKGVLLAKNDNDSAKATATFRSLALQI